MRCLKRMFAVLLSLIVAGSMCVPAQAANSKYTYTIRFLVGAQGKFDGVHNANSDGDFSGDGKVVTFQREAGSRVNFAQNMVALDNGVKYYVKGIRESGKDNNTVSNSSFVVEGDMDYVVAYGVLGNSVAYTINYQDRNGNALAPSETYYGNVGDRPVIAYLYIQGYQPQAYNLTRTLSENAADNVFTFIYTRVSQNNGGGGSGSSGGDDDDDGGGAGAGGGTTPAPGTTTPAPGAGDGGAGAGGDGTGAGGAGGAGEAGAGGTGDDAQAGGTGEGTEDTGPQEIVDLGDEDVPLANMEGGEDGETDVDASDFAVMMALPFSAKVGIVSAIILLAGSIVWLFLANKKRKKANE